MYDTNNIFAKILRKEISCQSIYEDEKVLFFHDINPKANIHVLAIPKKDVVDFNDFVLKSDQNEIKYFFTKIYQVIKELGLDKSGYRLITNNGKEAGQEVPHFHIHILCGKNLKELK